MLGKRNDVAAALVLGLAALTGCQKEAEVKKAPPLEVVVSQPIHEKISDWSIYTGTVQAKEVVEVRSRVRGHIKEVCFKEGEEIKANSNLFLIDAEPYEADLQQAKGLLATWEAKLKLADEKIKIYKPLADKGTISREELLQALSSKGEALGGIDTAKGKIQEAELNIGFSKIVSPIDGKVGLAQLTKGNLVNAGSDTVLTTVVSVDPMYVYFFVNERAIIAYQKNMRERAARLPEGQTLERPDIPVELTLAEESGVTFKGVVDFIDNRVDPNTGAIKIRAKFTNPIGPDQRRTLTPGMFARIRVTPEVAKPAILVADRAFLTDQNRKYLLAVDKAKGNEVKRIDVTASERLQPDGLREVVAGLKGDEWIIVEGVNRARPGAIVAPKDAPMPRQPADI